MKDFIEDFFNKENKIVNSGLTYSSIGTSVGCFSHLNKVRNKGF